MKHITYDTVVALIREVIENAEVDEVILVDADLWGQLVQHRPQHELSKLAADSGVWLVAGRTKMPPKE